MAGHHRLGVSVLPLFLATARLSLVPDASVLSCRAAHMKPHFDLSAILLALNALGRCGLSRPVSSGLCHITLESCHSSSSCDAITNVS
ncbi:hypothetical protein BC826DRAFT_1054541 [Russula brevipes]|nr:hypothetical protein BC826DRAFT_1054541 [Russula brevipes]